jgi:hypothetical protein
MNKRRTAVSSDGIKPKGDLSTIDISATASDLGYCLALDKLNWNKGPAGEDAGESNLNERKRDEESTHSAVACW